MAVSFFGGYHPAGGRLSPWLAVGFSTLAAGGQALAFEPSQYLNFSYGRLSLRPRVTVSEAYTDNAYFRENGPDKKGDFISNLGAGFSLTLGHRPGADPYNVLGEGGGPNYWGLDYSYGNNLYLDHRDLDGDQHNVVSNFRLQGNRLMLTGSDQFEMATSVLGGGINQGNKTTRNLFQDNYRLSYEISPKTSAYLMGSHATTDYAQGTPLYDNNNLTGTLGFALLALPKTSFFGEAYYGQAAVSPNSASVVKGPHLTSFGGFLGARGNFTTRIAGSVKVGYETREFSDRSPTEDSPVATVALSYRIGEKTRTTVSYTRLGSVSVQSPGESVTYDTLNWRLSHTLGSSSRWSTELGASSMLGGFGNQGARFAHRQDRQFQVSASLSYMIRLWMTASLSYEYEDFATNAEAQGIFDYSANRVTLRLSVGY